VLRFLIAKHYDSSSKDRVNSRFTSLACMHVVDAEIETSGINCQ
jgi:hypothetical protein